MQEILIELFFVQELLMAALHRMEDAKDILRRGNQKVPLLHVIKFSQLGECGRQSVTYSEAMIH